jgi:predicted nucleic-acid-binding protein
LIRSIDTNVVVRLILRDHEQQVAAAVAVLDEAVLLLPTVVQESVWVLESVRDLTRATITAQLRDFLTLPTLIVADADAVAWAIDQYAEGADFADMLHLALSRAADVFTTFDRRIARYADPSVVRVETLG